jgi:hypothetical protein
MQFMKKTVAWALIGLAIASAISFLILNDHWARLGPRQPMLPPAKFTLRSLDSLQKPRFT